MAMKFYRTHARLELPDGTQLQPGNIFTSRQLSEDKADKLIEMEIISQAQAPPLAAIPGWKSRAARLSKAGIETIGQLFEKNDQELADLFGVTKLEVVKQWKTDLLMVLEYRR